LWLLPLMSTNRPQSQGAPLRMSWGAWGSCSPAPYQTSKLSSCADDAPQLRHPTIKEIVPQEPVNSSNFQI
jgi:hypothetical protein